MAGALDGPTLEGTPVPDIMPHPAAPTKPAPPIAPLIDLLRTVAAQYGEVVIRVLPAGHLHASTGYASPAEHTVYLPAGREADDAALLVYALYELSVADTDPRVEGSASTFVTHAASRTLAAMGVPR
jgi:hypothetical protein